MEEPQPSQEKSWDLLTSTQSEAHIQEAAAVRTGDMRQEDRQGDRRQTGDRQAG